MTKALDRVKAAESKYTGMVETAEKLEATLKELKDPANSCQSSIWDLHRAVDRHRKNEKEPFWMFVLVAGVGARQATQRHRSRQEASPY